MPLRRRRFVTATLSLGVLAVGTLAFGGAPALANQSRTRLLPFDEGPNDPSLVAFRRQLIAALAARDHEFLEAHLHPNVVASFGHQKGPKAFMELMRAQPERWDIFAKVLEGGGGFRKYERDGKPTRFFEAPYTASAKLGPRWDDPFTTGIITGRDVRVRAKPGTISKIVARLSFDIVLVENWRPDEKRPDWVLVRTHDGKRGFVHEDYITTQADWRVLLTKANSKWVVDAFLAGD